MSSLNSSKNTSKLNIEQDKKFDIYKDYTVADIKANIYKNQFWLLSMHDMAFVASLADSSIVLTPPVKFSNYGKYTEEAEKRYQEDRVFTAENFMQNVKANHKLESRYNIRNQLFEKIKEVYPEFGHNMQDKISPEDYALYSKNLKKFKKSISISLISANNMSSSEALLQEKDKISEVIDSIDFTRACEVEDNFMISELDIFFEKLQTMPNDIQHSFAKHNIPMPDGKKYSYMELAQKAKNDRIKRIEKYSKIYNIYEKLKKHPYIKLGKSELEDNESR